MFIFHDDCSPLFLKYISLEFIQERADNNHHCKKDFVIHKHLTSSLTVQVE